MKYLVRSWRWKCSTKTQTRMTSWGGSFLILISSFFSSHFHISVLSICVTLVLKMNRVFIFNSLLLCVSACRVKVDLDIVRKARIVDDVSTDDYYYLLFLHVFVFLLEQLLHYFPLKMIFVTCKHVTLETPCASL